MVGEAGCLSRQEEGLRVIEAFLIGFVLGGVMGLAVWIASPQYKPEAKSSACCDEYLQHIEHHHPEMVAND